MWLKETDEHDVLVRYIGTTDGVMRFYPGFKMNKNRDYTVEQWFAQAVRNKDSIIITTATANLFESSSKPTLTLSKAITYRASSNVFGVMGMDVTVDFFYNQIIDVYPECQQKYNCFVMDRSGYLLAHGAILSGSSSKSNFQRRHVTEEEMLFSKELIDDDIMVRKACINYQDIKRQYYYEVVEIEGGVIDKLATSGCIQYRIQFIPNTNAVFVIISTQLSCNFNCYCSRVNCVSEDAYTCECPCAEDEKLFDYCDFEYDVDQDSIPSCTPPLFVVPSDDDAPSTEGLQPCIQTDCSSKSPSSCSSSAVCEMCDSECKDILQNCGEQPTSSSNTMNNSDTNIIVIAAAASAVCIVLLIVSCCFIIKKRGCPNKTNKQNDASLPATGLRQQTGVACTSRNDLIYFTSIDCFNNESENYASANSIIYASVIDP
ncbi:VWFA and cache domain-containing protein 1-like [Anneissia japonica]|uniref:VWFA and cache domain-containing protein 1-like n=1 Tax=Anneissia japonica TaxID=1529436 RepID=UPI0014256227|nr:VWFA and cache domain-containing protein 1-like [Anneissia japonica]